MGGLLDSWLWSRCLCKSKQVKQGRRCQDMLFDICVCFLFVRLVVCDVIIYRLSFITVHVADFLFRYLSYHYHDCLCIHPTLFIFKTIPSYYHHILIPSYHHTTIIPSVHIQQRSSSTPRPHLLLHRPKRQPPFCQTRNPQHPGPLSQTARIPHPIIRTYI